MGELCPLCGALPCDETAAVEWRTMESAPRDRDILVYVAATNEQFVAYWGTCPEDGDQQWTFARGDGISFIVRDPTHWLPLPAVDGVEQVSA